MPGRVASHDVSSRLQLLSNAPFDSHTLSVNELRSVGSEWEMGREMGSLLSDSPSFGIGILFHSHTRREHPRVQAAYQGQRRVYQGGKELSCGGCR